MLNRLIRLSVYGFFALAIAGSGVAFAQGDPCEEGGDVCEGDEGGGDEGGGDEGGGDEGGGDEGGGDEGGGDEGGGDAGGTSGSYPVAYLARPRTIPGGSWEAGLDIAFLNTFDAIAVGGPSTSNPFGGGLNFVYGISDALNVSASYGFSLKAFEIKGALNVGAQYLVIHNNSMQVRAAASFGYHAAYESIGPFSVGGLVQYNLNDKMAVFTSPGFIMAPAILDVRASYIALPVGFGYQVSDNIYAQVDTLVANIKVSNAVTQIIGADVLPVTVTGMYSMGNTMDVGASFGLDLVNSPGDTIIVGLMARYRGGL